MWFKFAKLFFTINTSLQGPTSLLVSNDPNVVNYDITKNMIKHVKYNKFDDWATIPWNSAYFDVDQPDLKLVSGDIIGGYDNHLNIDYQSDVTGVNKKILDTGTGVYEFNSNQLDDISRIMFNHNFVEYGKKNRFMVYNTNLGIKPLNLRFELNFEIDKPLSFYIQGFVFYFMYEGFLTFTGDFAFSFLDYEGKTKYVFKGTVGNDVYMQDLYNFVTMPVRVPNLKHLTVFFDIHGTTTSTVPPDVQFGQINIFSSENITPVPPNSPFNAEYERVSWYDVFGHLRNAFRWLLYGVVGKVLPVAPLREFFTKLDEIVFQEALNYQVVLKVNEIVPKIVKIKGEFNKFQEKFEHLIPLFMNFKKLNNTKKPREKAIKYGFDALSDNELLAIILRTGTKEKNVLFLAQEIITNFNGLENLNKVTIKSLMSIKGIGISKALEILSCLEIIKRIKIIESQKKIF